MFRPETEFRISPADLFHTFCQELKKKSYGIRVIKDIATAVELSQSVETGRIQEADINLSLARDLAAIIKGESLITVPNNCPERVYLSALRVYALKQGVILGSFHRINHTIVDQNVINDWLAANQTDAIQAKKIITKGFMVRVIGRNKFNGDSWFQRQSESRTEIIPPNLPDQDRVEYKFSAKIYQTASGAYQDPYGQLVIPPQETIARSSIPSGESRQKAIEQAIAYWTSSAVNEYTRDNLSAEIAQAAKTGEISVPLTHNNQLSVTDRQKLSAIRLVAICMNINLNDWKINLQQQTAVAQIVPFKVGITTMTTTLTAADVGEKITDNLIGWASGEVTNEEGDLLIPSHALIKQNNLERYYQPALEFWKQSFPAIRDNYARIILDKAAELDSDLKIDDPGRIYLIVEKQQSSLPEKDKPRLAAITLLALALGFTINGWYYSSGAGTAYTTLSPIN